jgi:hypothetical protein
MLKGCPVTLAIAEVPPLPVFRGLRAEVLVVRPNVRAKLPAEAGFVSPD